VAFSKVAPHPVCDHPLPAKRGEGRGEGPFNLFGFGKGIMTIHDLPAVNALLNGLSAVFLTAGYIFIRRKNQTAHRNCMMAAFCTSIVFLSCYLTYHLNVQTITHFRNPAWFRPIYRVILLTHTLLAVVIVPLILVTLNRARRQNFEAHKKIARWTWPLWMYVSVTGVVVYLLLYQIFPQ
jgi:putative membrane protein